MGLVNASPFHRYGVIGPEVRLSFQLCVRELTKRPGPGDSPEDVKWLDGILSDFFEQEDMPALEAKFGASKL